MDQEATRVDNRDGMTQVPRVLLHEVTRYANGSLLKTSGVAIPGPTRALAQASTYLALASKTDKNHVIIY